MDLLMGQYLVKLTDKGRLALPSKFKKVLGTQVIVAKWYEGCIVVVDASEWESLLNKLTGKEKHITASVRDTDRFILGSAFEVELDAQGRFVVPKVLLNYAGVGNEAVFLGLGDRVEIWDKDAWREKEIEVQESASALIEKIADDAKQ